MAHFKQQLLVHFTFSLTPYTRGKQFEKMSADNQLRITPVYAGNTPRARLYPDSERDHPRLCGEYLNRQVPEWRKPGSPPSMRGILLRQCKYDLRTGITPVYAGNTLSFMLFAMIDEDHPRLCGEYLKCGFDKIARQGSPPSMRGILDRLTLQRFL